MLKTPLALDDITVIDCCWLLPGQFTAMMLGDLGARVIHVERPGGDYSREQSPYIFAAANRGKESLTLDLKEPAAQEVLHRLVKRSDVLVEGFRPGVMKRLGADYETLSEIQPGLIYCSLSGFGQNGSPHAHKPGHGLNYAAIAGLQHVAGDSISLAPTLGDLSGTVFAAISVLAALHFRTRTGRGQFIDLSITDAVYALLTDMLAGGHHGGSGARRVSASFGVFETADGKRMTIGAAEDHFFQKFMVAIGHPEVASDPRYLGENRRNNEPALAPMVQARIKSRPRHEWMEILERAGVPCAFLNDLNEAVTDEHAVARDIVTWVDQPGLGPVAQIRFPGVFSEMGYRRGELAPEPSQHTDPLLEELGYTKKEVEALKAGGAV